MLDIKFIRNNVQLVKDAIKNKQLSKTIDLDRLLELDKEILNLTSKLNDLRSKRNDLDDQIKTTKDLEEKKKYIAQSTELKPVVKDIEDRLNALKPEFDGLMLWVPNPPAADVPVGEDESGNKVLYAKGEKKTFDFEPKDHLNVAEALGIIDTKRGSKIAGFRGYFVCGKGMLLEQALLRYALDFMVEKGFTPMNVPIMVDKRWLTGTGYFPWGKEDHYYTQDDEALVGTAEVSLTAYYADETLDEADLPVKLTGQSLCFRREVGSHGKDTKGVFRVHTFNKVEQVVLLPADEDLTREWHDKMRDYAEEILQGLGLHYQVLLMCTGDMGASQRRKYDIETWFPGQKKFRETHSDSYFNDFQSRRLNMKYRTKSGETKYVYTLNNTVAATPRLLAAVIENYQNEDGSITVPEVLRKYTGFSVIELVSNQK
jgi:seryl-tRNA synthetase